MKLRQITKRDTANCHIKNQPTATFIVKKVAEFEIMHTSVQRMRC